MKRKIVYGERVRFETNFEIFLKFVLLLVHKTVKAMSSVAQRISPSGIDNKKITKE